MYFFTPIYMYIYIYLYINIYTFMFNCSHIFLLTEQVWETNSSCPRLTDLLSVAQWRFTSPVS